VKGAEWTGREVRILARLYPAGGTRACLSALPARSKCAIRAAARDLGLRRQGRKPGSGAWRRQQRS